MSIIDTVKKNVKPIMGVVIGLATAGVSVYSALHSSSTEDDYDCSDEIEVIDFGSEDTDETPSEEEVDEAE